MKTANIELSKKLSKAGFPQKSHSSWVQGQLVDSRYTPNGNGDCSAPTADELLDELPTRTTLTLQILKGTKKYACSYWWGIPSPLREDRVTDYHRTHADNPADAVGEMWLYLKEHDLL